MKKVDYKNLVNKSKTFILAHGLILAVVFVAISYAYLLVKIAVYKSASISTTEAPAVTLRIDKNAVDKLNSLQDNSVQVQAIFNDVRNNPF